MPPENWRRDLPARLHRFRVWLIESALPQTKTALSKIGPAMDRALNALDRLALPTHIRKVLPERLKDRVPENFKFQSALREGFPAFLSRLVKRDRNFQVTFLAIFFSTFFLADLTALLIERYIPEPPPPGTLAGGQSQRTPNLDDYNVVFTRNLFSSAGVIAGEAPVVPGAAQQPDVNAPATPTTLPFHLIGTVILKDELRSLATIEDKAASLVYPVRSSDEIPGKAKITDIFPTRVEFLNLASGRREFIELPKDNFSSKIGIASTISAKAPEKKSGIESTGTNKFNIPRDEINKTLADLNNVLTQARCIPNFKNGQPNGFKCFQIAPGSI
ncbi:MAG: hypothetical protein AAB425_01380, partial [Bdellovibrionota bacterium]